MTSVTYRKRNTNVTNAGNSRHATLKREFETSHACSVFTGCEFDSEISRLCSLGDVDERPRREAGYDVAHKVDIRFDNSRAVS
jgi:hypothetical protein